MLSASAVWPIPTAPCRPVFRRARGRVMRSRRGNNGGRKAICPKAKVPTPVQTWAPCVSVGGSAEEVDECIDDCVRLFFRDGVTTIGHLEHSDVDTLGRYQVSQVLVVAFIPAPQPFLLKAKVAADIQSRMKPLLRMRKSAR